MTSLNQLLKKLSEIALAHAQIKSYHQGQIYDASADGAIEYPCLWAVPNGGTPDIKGNLFLYKISLFMMDKDNSDGSNQIDILSDTTLILLDVLSKLEHESDSPNEWGIESVTEFTPFVDSQLDTVTGHSTELTIGAFFGSDICNGIIT